MNVHSLSRMPTSTSLRRSVSRGSGTAGDKREALSRAAIKVFARSGFFNAQVADVARAAGVAEGTVYLYFRNKDELLTSIFERTMQEGITEGQAALRSLPTPSNVSELSRGFISVDLAETAIWPWSFRSSFVSRRSSWSASHRRSFERISGNSVRLSSTPSRRVSSESRSTRRWQPKRSLVPWMKWPPTGF